MTVPGGDQRHDPREAGLPLWAKVDQGPRGTYVPGPLPTDPLPTSYGWQTRIGIAAALAVAVAVVVVRGGQSGTGWTLLAVLLALLAYAVPVWLRGRRTLWVDGDRATVRGHLREVTFTGGEVREVRYVYQGRSPDVRLVLDDGRRVHVPTSTLERGHSTLFEWLRRFAPQAAYDTKATDLRDMLVNRGLIAAPGEPASGPAPMRPTPMRTEGTATPAAASNPESAPMPPARTTMDAPTTEDGMSAPQTSGGPR